MQFLSLPCMLLGIAFVGAMTPSAYADWTRIEARLPKDALYAVEADPAVGLLLQTPRTLTVVNPLTNRTRRSFTLPSQTDALVDIAVASDGWWLASKRSIWRSRDKGYSWRKEHTQKRGAKEQWYGFVPVEGVLYAVTANRTVPLTRGRARPPRFGRVGGLQSHGAGAVVDSSRGLFVLGRHAYRYGEVNVPDLRAFYSSGATHFVAHVRGVLRCERTCSTEAGIPGIRSIVEYEGAYWAASTDAVWRRNHAGIWSPQQGGLGTAFPGHLAVYGDSLYYAGGSALYRWEELQEASAPALDAAAYRPTMAAVRRMVRDARPTLFRHGADWLDRVRWKAAAPVVDVSIRRGLDERTGLTRGNTIGVSTTENRILLGPDGRSATRTQAGAWDYGISFRWDLDDLVFHQQELSISNEVEDLFRLRESIMLDVTRIYHDRIRALHALRSSPSDRERQDAFMRVAELTAGLDYYTGGRFSQALAEGGP